MLHPIEPSTLRILHPNGKTGGTGFLVAKNLAMTCAHVVVDANTIDGWLADTIPYLLLAAPAGRGKSALLVRWLDSLKARDDLALAFVIGDCSEATCAC